MSARVLALVGALLLLSACSPAELPGDRSFVQSEWTKGIERLGLGLNAVYPPSEDYQVGDVYAVGEPCPDYVTQWMQNPVPTYLKIGLANVRDRLVKEYSQRLLFPDFPQPSDAASANLPPAVAIATQSRDEDQHQSQMTPVPIVAFPEFTLAAGKLAEFAGTGASDLFGFLFGSASRSDVGLSIKVKAGETYGLNAYDASAALAEFCSLSGRCNEKTLVADLIASYGPGFCNAKISMINRVYMTRNLVYEYNFDSAKALSATLVVTQQEALDRQKDLADILKATPVAPAAAASVADPNQTAAGGAPATSATTDMTLATLSVRDQVMTSLLGGLKTDLDKLGQSGAPGGFVTLASYSDQQIALSQAFVRPIVFGYNSMSCQPRDSTEPTLGVQCPLTIAPAANGPGDHAGTNMIIRDRLQ